MGYKESPLNWAKQWTRISAMCHKRQCICKGCYYENFFESGKCQCKYAVIDLFRRLGEPPDFKDDEQKDEVL